MDEENKTFNCFFQAKLALYGCVEMRFPPSLIRAPAMLILASFNPQLRCCCYRSLSDLPKRLFFLLSSPLQVMMMDCYYYALNPRL